MTTSFFKRTLVIIVWLIEKAFSIDETTVVFNRIRTSNGGIFTGDINQVKLKEGQKVDVSVELKTAAGNEAAYQEGSVTWETSDASVATVTVNSDNELEAVVRGVNGSDNGAAVITFRADGDPDADETREIIGTLDVVVTKGEAYVVEIKAGAPTDDNGTQEELPQEEESSEKPETEA